MIDMMASVSSYSESYKYLVSGSAEMNMPVVPYCGMLWYDIEEAACIPMDYPLGGVWGQVLSDNSPLKDTFPLPFAVSACWLSLLERKFYICEEALNLAFIKKQYKDLEQADNSDIYFVLGFGCSGLLTLWIQNQKRSIIVMQLQGDEVDMPMKIFMPVRPDLDKEQFCKLMLKQYGMENSMIISDNTLIKNKFRNRQIQYNQKYLIEFLRYDKERWLALGPDNIKPVLSYFAEALTDGTYNKLNDGALMKSHMAGKPKQIAIVLTIEKSEYKAFFWMDEESIHSVFERFYGAHPETKADFIIRIDVENKKYELALYRQGLKEPVVIPESAYQLIVFKNKFEDYRSENYNQPRGAWIW